mmetsp:Transcript_41055/g.66044  ORF Transcript_41055/g.66044 Transcript_41055/m.66044 type:complete len:246 (+) Transcript_41055:528-1265(+)
MLLIFVADRCGARAPRRRRRVAAALLLALLFRGVRVSGVALRRGRRLQVVQIEFDLVVVECFGIFLARRGLRLRHRGSGRARRLALALQVSQHHVQFVGAHVVDEGEAMQHMADIARVSGRHHLLHERAELGQFRVVDVAPVLLDGQSIVLEALEVERDVVEHDQARSVAAQQCQVFVVAAVGARRAVIAEQDVRPNALHIGQLHLRQQHALHLAHQAGVHFADRRSPQHDLQLLVRHHLREEVG